MTMKQYNIKLEITYNITEQTEQQYINSPYGSVPNGLEAYFRNEYEISENIETSTLDKCEITEIK